MVLIFLIFQKYFLNFIMIFQYIYQLFKDL